MTKKWTGAEVRQSFIDFFVSKGHTFVQSASLVPGGDQTLLFNNAGMVQFKDVFLGTDKRPYVRAANSQKCMRVAGKHNDLDDVGRDNTHHTFFEMLGNWSFGDYYKKEAITWAWELLTDVWGLDKSKLWVTCFKDDKGNIPTDEEAAENWRKQPGINPEHVVYFGRKENFWEMAETGPCGPCSEIHMDFGPEYCNKKGVAGHVCSVNGDCSRYTELWNLVFIQYNRQGPTQLDPLPATHVDTGMGLERIVSVLQGTYSNYKTDLLLPLMDKVLELSGHSISEREENLTPYRVIADHARAASFLIADGVVPGNIGRNYICRMIIRRAAQFGTKIGLVEPFLAKVADIVIENYGKAYPELTKNKGAILSNFTREEERFKRTVEAGIGHLDELLADLQKSGGKVLNGKDAFDLYATHGLPLEITRDLVREKSLDVDEAGFRQSMEEHRLASGGGKAFGPLGGEDVDTYREIFEHLISDKTLTEAGVVYKPYGNTKTKTSLVCLIKDGESVKEAHEGDEIEAILPETCFYVESGGQVSDMGRLVSDTSNNPWTIEINDIQKPAAGIIVHVGKVIKGSPKTGDKMTAIVDEQRRKDIMRNHTATHLLHAELRSVLGEHARQAGSSVTPNHLRFDFTHSEGMSAEQLERVERGVNRVIMQNYALTNQEKDLAAAISEGAMALFGEKYGDRVRTVVIGSAEEPTPVSYELCGGTHVSETGDIGLFLITSESSAAAGIRRIEAVTGKKAYELVQHRFGLLKQTAGLLECSIEETPDKTRAILDDLSGVRKQNTLLKQELAGVEFAGLLTHVSEIKGIPVLAAKLENTDADTLRQMTDKFKEKHPSGVVVLASSIDDKPVIVAVVTEDLTKRGLNAGELVKAVAQVVGGGGGGRPTLAQAGGKDSSKIDEALGKVQPFVSEHLKG